MKFKRFLSLLLALCLTLGMFPVTSSATGYWDAGVCGENAGWVLEEDGTLYIKGTGDMDDFTYETAPWSAYRYDIRKVVISDGITGIGQCAFYALPNVTDISIPDSVTAIAYCGIAECTSLTSLTLPDRLESISEYAFYQNTGITGITVPDSVTEIAYYAFADCTGLKSIDLSGSLQYIGDYAFARCTSLESITLPDSVAELTYGVLADCTSLKSIGLPESLQYIGDGALSGCSSLESIALPETVTTISYFALADCTSLTDITLPQSLETISDYAFGWSGINTMTFTGDAPQIDANAFYDITADAWIPSDNDTWTEDVLCSYGGDITWLQEDPAPEAPTVSISGNETTGRNVLSWNAVENAIKYAVYVSTDGENYKRLTTTAKTGITHSSANAGIQYFYYVIALDADGNESEPSNAVSRCCTCLPPELTVTVNENGKPVLSWDAVEGAVKYEIQRSEDGKTFTRLITTAKTGITNSSAEPGKTYYYKVKAIAENTDANSDFSDVQSAVCVLTRPELTVTTNENGKPVLSWDAVDGAEKYEIQRSEDGKTFTRLITTAKTGITNSSAEPGKTYYYKVKAIAENTDANSDFSDVQSAVCVLTRPELTVTTNENGKPVLSWGAAEGAVKYAVYRATSENGTYSHLITTDKVSITNTSAEPGKTYYYKVKALAENETANSPFSGVKSALCTLARPSIKLTRVSATGKIKISWAKVTGAKSYTVYRSTNGKSWSKLKNTTSLSYTDKTAEPGKTYYYKVKAIAKITDANSAFSAVKKLTCGLAQPKLSLSTVAATGKIKISWAKVTGAGNYEIYRSTDGKTWSKIKTTTSLSYTDKSVSAGKTYYYKVRALNSTGKLASEYAAVRSTVATLAQPEVSLSNVAATGKIKISWTKITGAAKYAVYCSTDGGESYELLKVVTGTSLTHNSGKAGKTYHYQVVAVAKNEKANSAPSEEQSKVCDLARPSVTLSRSRGKPKLKWGKVSGAKQYEIYRSTNGKTWSKIKTTTSLNYLDTGAKFGKTYYYRVVAIASNSAANSAKFTTGSIKSR